MAECCGNGNRLVYSCSGGADVGEISDRVARLLMIKGFARPSCLAGVGGHISGFVASAKNAAENITIDGCSLTCAKKTLEHIGVTPTSYVLTDMGLVKGKTPPNEAVVLQVCKVITGEATSTHTKQSETSDASCTCGSC